VGGNSSGGGTRGPAAGGLTASNFGGRAGAVLATAVGAGVVVGAFGCCSAGRDAPAPLFLSASAREGAAEEPAQQGYLLMMVTSGKVVSSVGASSDWRILDCYA
jgi:hypothetical protein